MQSRYGAVPVHVGGRQRRSISVLLPASLLAFGLMGCFSHRGSLSPAFASPSKAAGSEDETVIFIVIAVIGFCSALAATELALPPPKQVPLEKRADFSGALYMSAFLSLLSGMVNAMAILDMGMTVAHHTGNASHTGRLLGEGALKFFVLMIAFWLGAAVVGFSKSDGEAVFSRRFSPGMLSAGLAVLCGCLIRFLCGSGPLGVNSTLILWSFSQGIQNAITRKCSSSPVSTSHHTGNLTDVGSGLGAAMHASMSGDEANVRRPGFFALSIFAFGAGGYIMKLARPLFGAQAVLAPAFLMCAVGLGLVPLVEAPSQKTI